MNRMNLPNGSANDPEAVKQRDRVNTEIGQIQAEQNAIDEEARAIVDTAINSAKEDDAEKLLKRIDKIRARRLAVSIRELRLIGFENDVNQAVKRAAREEVARLQGELAKRESELNACADQLGLAADAVQRTQLVRTDMQRNQLIAQAKDANFTVSNWFYKSSDAARDAELIQSITDCLKV